MKNLKINNMGTEKQETLIYGCKVNEPDYMEEIIFKCGGRPNIEKLKKKVEPWGKKNGYDRIRVSVVDLNEPLGFASTVKL